MMTILSLKRNLDENEHKISKPAAIIFLSERKFIY